jgi:hypothetical protein
LVLAQGNVATGLANIDRKIIYRLRKAIDRALGRGVGAALIQHGCGEEYRLAIPAGKAKARVGVTKCFFELVGLRLLTEEDAATIRKTCHAATKRETAR